MQGDEHARAPPGELRRQVVWQGGAAAGADPGLQRKPGQADVDVLVFPLLFHRAALPLQVFRAEAAALIRPFGAEPAHGVPDAERPFIGEELRLDGDAVENPGENHERAQPAFGRGLAERAVEGQEAEKIARLHRLRNLPVELRPFRGKAVGPILLQLVRKVAARNHHRAPVQLFGRARDASAEVVMRERVQTGNRAPHQAVAAVFAVHERQRDQRAVVDRGVPFPERPGRDAHPLRLLRQRLDELRIIGEGNRPFLRAELPEVPARARARRNVQIVRIKHGMGRSDHDGFRLELRDFARGLSVGPHCFFNSFFFPFSDRRDNHGRMGHDERTDNRHTEIPPFVP